MGSRSTFLQALDGFLTDAKSKWEWFASTHLTSENDFDAIFVLPRHCSCVIAASFALHNYAQSSSTIGLVLRYEKTLIGHLQRHFSSCQTFAIRTFAI